MPIDRTGALPKALAERSIAVTPPDLVNRILAAAGNDLVLIGGQALAYWMDKFGVRMPEHVMYVSRDLDFLTLSAGDNSVVYRIARLIGGQALIRSKHELTALVGQAVLELGADEYVNVDVVFQVFGSKAEKVRDAAIEVERDDVVVRIMHPMDVLKSRLDNLYGLKEKQGELGEHQLAAAILVAARFQQAVHREHQQDEQRSPTLPFVKFIERLALSDAGRKVAERTGLYVADAIAPELIQGANFQTKKLPQLLRLMSEERRAEIQKGMSQSPASSHSEDRADGRVERPKA